MGKIKPVILPVILSVLVLSMAISPSYPSLIPAYAVEVTPVLEKKCNLQADSNKPVSPDCEILNLIIAEEAARIAADEDLQEQIDDATDSANETKILVIAALGVAAGSFATLSAGLAIPCPPCAVAAGTISGLLTATAAGLALIDF